MLFWHVFIVMTLLCATFVLWPLLKSYRFSKKALREDVRIDICENINEQNLAELEKTLAFGEISEKEFSSLKIDLEKTLTHDNEHARAQHHAPITSQGRSREILLGVALVVPFVVITLYQYLGASPDWKIKTSLDELHQAQSEQDYRERARSLYLQIAARVEDKPDDLNLRFLAGSAATAAGRTDDAIEIYRELAQEHPDQPEILLELTQALMQRSGGNITAEIRQHIQKLLIVSPEMPSALGLAGIDAFQRGEYEQAIEYWSNALRRAQPGSEDAAAFSEAIVRAQTALKASGGSSSRQADQGSGVDLKVSIAEAIELTGDEVVYVYARPWQGPRMPLATKRMRVADLPADVRLDNSDTMAFGRDLNSVPQIEVVARISMDGGPITKSGDWIASHGPLTLSELKGPIELHISEKIP